MLLDGDDSWAARAKEPQAAAESLIKLYFGQNPINFRRCLENMV